MRPPPYTADLTLPREELAPRQIGNEVFCPTLVLRGTRTLARRGAITK
jgi:hypothetical protein